MFKAQKGSAVASGPSDINLIRTSGLVVPASNRTLDTVVRTTQLVQWKWYRATGFVETNCPDGSMRAALCFGTDAGEPSSASQFWGVLTGETSGVATVNVIKDSDVFSAVNADAVCHQIPTDGMLMFDVIFQAQESTLSLGYRNTGGSGFTIVKAFVSLSQLN